MSGGEFFTNKNKTKFREQRALKFADLFSGWKIYNEYRE